MSCLIHVPRRYRCFLGKNLALLLNLNEEKFRYAQDDLMVDKPATLYNMSS